MSLPRGSLLKALLLGSAVLAHAAEPVKLTGTATYRERIALESGSVLEVELLDVSRADTPAPRLASIRQLAETQVPVKFSLYYDPALVQEDHVYSVSARLLSGERVIFRSNTINPVLTRGAGDTVDILLVRTNEPLADSPLVGQWTNNEFGGLSEITFTREGRAFGTGGCNSFNGSYTADAQAFAIGNLVTTLRACEPRIMNQETRFHEALGKARSWKMGSGELHLTDADGAAVLRLQPRS